MHLSGGSGWHTRKGRRSSPWRILILLILIGGVLYYVSQLVSSSVSPPFVPTPTPTRSALSYIEEGEAFFATGKFKRAIEAYKRAIQVDPVNLDIHVTLARIQVFAGDYESALKNAENAILINPDSARAHAVRGRALSFLPDRDTEAEAALIKALQLDPALPEAHAYYAEVLSDQLSWLEAANEARKALELAPSLLDTRLAMAYVFTNTGNYEEAIAEYGKAQAINPNVPAIYLALGDNYRALGDIDTAINNYQRTIALNPEDPAPYSRIAQTYGTVGEYGRASQYAEQARDLNQADPRMHGLLGRLYYHNNELEKSLPELELATRGGLTTDGVQVKGLQPEPGVVAEYYYTYGLALVKLERCDDALPLFELLLATLTDEHAEIALFNAREGISQCQELEDQPVTPEATPET